MAAWQHGGNSERALLHNEIESVVRNVFLQHRRRYGARRISVELKSMGYECSRAKAGKILDKLNLVAIQPKSFKPRTTDSGHRLGYNPNLLAAGVAVTKRNQVWVGDITYVGIEKAFGYMSMLMDLFSRRIVGWKIDSDMKNQLVIESLRQAISSRQPPPGLIHHTDRGGQYASKRYRAILKRAQMQQSMSRAGDCYDNAFMESCFGTIKNELDMKTYSTLQEARNQIQEYVDYYNSIRRHSSLSYQSPNSFELALQN